MNVGGGYSSGDYPVTGPSSICTGQYAYYNTVHLPLATSYNWFWPTSWQYGSGQGTRYLDLYVPSGASSGAVGVRVATACDAGGSPATQFTSVSNCGSFMMSVYPNAASNELSIEPMEEVTADVPDYQVKLFDDSGNLRKAGKSEKGKVKLDIRDLRNALYQLHIISKSETVASQVLIER